MTNSKEKGQINARPELYHLTFQKIHWIGGAFVAGKRNVILIFTWSRNLMLVRDKRAWMTQWVTFEAIELVPLTFQQQRGALFGRAYLGRDASLTALYLQHSLVVQRSWCSGYVYCQIWRKRRSLEVIIGDILVLPYRCGVSFGMKGFVVTWGFPWFFHFIKKMKGNIALLLLAYLASLTLSHLFLSLSFYLFVLLPFLQNLTVSLFLTFLPLILV